MSSDSYSSADLEDILKDIRNIVMKYKRHKHEYSAIQVQDLRDDLAVLRVQLADIGADLYGMKIEAAASYEGAKLRKEEAVENELNALHRSGSKQTNVADRAKRTAKLEISSDEMIKTDKMNRLAINLYQFSVPDVLNAMASRIAVRARYNQEDVQRKEFKTDDNEEGFEMWNDVEKRVITGVDNLETEIGIT